MSNFFQNLFQEYHFLIFIFYYWIWFKFKTIIPIYFSIIFSIITLLPFLFQNLSFTKLFLLFFSTTLIYSSMILTNFEFSKQIFFTFLHLDLSGSFLSSSSYSMLLFLFELILLFFEENLTRFDLLFLGISYFSAISYQVVFLEKKIKIFTIKTSFLMSIFTVFSEEKINFILFILSLIFSLPRKPIPSAPQALSSYNKKCLIYLFFSTSLNIYCFYFGIINSSLSLSSDAMMSICNNISIFGAIIADVASRMNPSKLFSYGFSRATILCDIFASLLLIITSINVFSSSISTILNFSNNHYNENAIYLILLSLISLIINLIGAMFINNTENLNCNFNDSASLAIFMDLISSFSVVISSFLVVVFKISFIDPFVSLFIGIILIIASIYPLKNSILILLETNLKNFNFNKFSLKSNSLINGNIWSLTSNKEIITFKIN